MIHRLHYKYLNNYLTFHHRYVPQILRGDKGGKQEKTQKEVVTKTDKKMIDAMG